MIALRKEWIEPGAIVKVDMETTGELVRAVQQLHERLEKVSAERRFFGEQVIAGLEREAALTTRIMELCCGP
jgi:hypothetical protein